ncbi:MAG: DUF4851 domain-containing protein [Desulfovibrionaceae bacterium]
MLLKKTIVVVGCMLLLSACAGQKKGMEGASLVSSSRPSIDISVPALPLRTSGFTVANVTTSDSLGGVPVNTWLAVYGGTTLTQPMAVTAIAVAPPQYYWDSDLTHIFSTDRSIALYNAQGFSACTYIIDGAHDAFISLLPVENAKNVKLLARRFALRTNFDETKITMEYREPLPADITNVADMAMYDRKFLDAFEKRAYESFMVQPFISSATPISNSYVNNVQTRFMNTNFLGTMTRYDATSYD